MAEIIINKRCGHCKITKPTSDFYRDRSRKDGYQSQCKKCGKKIAKKYRSTERAKELVRQRAAKRRNTIKGQEYDYHYRRSEKNKLLQKRYANTKAGKKTREKAATKYAQEFPEKRNAKSAVNCAVRKGTLPRIRTQKCFLCHRQAYQYHHYKGYAKKHWLDVMPLCYKCDKFIHFCLNALKFQCEERFE